ncbi:MAG: SAM-dependent methyltransferase [Acidobacteriota bacterium]|nr:SAM-dependent methyltransferase [Acidobacteriota bacterium]
MAKTFINSNDVERDYAQITLLTHRKKFAQFFTPPPIAELMAEWLLGNGELQSVLEPAFGLGIFSRNLLKYKPDLSIKGYEIDVNIFQRAKALFANDESVRLRLEDYIYNDWNNKYDGIICNPPYFKFHDYDNKNIIGEIEEKISFKLNGSTNLYALFLLKSLYQLKINGRAAYIIPSEFLNSDYGKLIKSYIVENKSLRHVIIVDFEENVFDDALTTSSILLFANDEKADLVQFSNVKSLDDLNEIKQIVSNDSITNSASFKFKDLDPKVKWRTYYQKQNSLEYKNLVPFSTYGKVVRGIATGANKYFTFNQSKAEKYNISPKYLLPCVCKAMDVKNSFFTKEDFEKLKENDKPIFLLNAVNPIDDAVKDYLKKGETEGIHKKFLTASRKPWYSLENRPPAPIWVSVFNRNGLRFIRNEANISNLTTFHCIYLNIFSLPKTDLLFAYLLTDVSRQIFEDNRREYGNGLQKFEPNDINKAKMLDLNFIDALTEKRILELYKNYRQSSHNKKTDETLVNAINDIFVEKFT